MICTKKVFLTMKYTEEFAKKVISKTDIVRLIARHTPLNLQGNVYTGDCPFNPNEKDTFVVYPDKQTFHCFDCDASGNAAMFLVLKEDISMTEAIEKLARITRTPITPADINHNNQDILKENMYNIYRDAALFYMNKLQEKDGEQALNYLSQNREFSDATIKRFGLGYAPTKGNALYKYLKAKGYDDEIMLKAGLIKISETGPYDMFRGRVMFPIINEQKRVIAFSGRVLDNAIKPKYLNSPETPIFNKSNTLFGIQAVPHHSPFWLLCEGQADVIALHQAGFNNAVATLGTAFTQTHIPLLKKYTDNKLVLTFDSDDAGQKAAMRAIKTLEGHDINISVISMDPYKDPDEFIKELGPEEYARRIERGMDKINFELKYLSKQFDLNDPQQKQAYLTKAVSRIIESSQRELDNIGFDIELDIT